MVTTPCMMIMMVGSSLTPAIVKETWMLLLWPLIFHIIGVCVCWPLSSLCSIPPFFRRHFICAGTVGNTTALPMVLLQALCNMAPLNEDEANFDILVTMLFTYNCGWFLLVYGGWMNFLDGAAPHDDGTATADLHEVNLVVTSRLRWLCDLLRKSFLSPPMYAHMRCARCCCCCAWLRHPLTHVHVH